MDGKVIGRIFFWTLEIQTIIFGFRLRTHSKNCEIATPFHITSVIVSYFIFFTELILFKEKERPLFLLILCLVKLRLDRRLKWMGQESIWMEQINVKSKFNTSPLKINCTYWMWLQWRRLVCTIMTRQHTLWFFRRNFKFKIILPFYECYSLSI